MPEAQTRLGIGGNKPPTTAQLLKEKHKAIFDRAKAWLAKARRADLAPKTLEDCAKLEALFGEGRDIANDGNRIREAEKAEPLERCKEIDGLFNGELRDAIGSDPKAGGLARDILQAAADRRAAITRAEQARLAADAERSRKEADRLEGVRQNQEDRGQVKQADVTAAKVGGLDNRADALEAAAAAPMAEASRGRAGGRSVSVDMKLECTGVIRADLDLEALRPYFKQEHLVDAVQSALKLKAFTTLKGAAISERAVGRVR